MDVYKCFVGLRISLSMRENSLFCGESSIGVNIRLSCCRFLNRRWRGYAHRTNELILMKVNARHADAISITFKEKSKHIFL